MPECGGLDLTSHISQEKKNHLLNLKADMQKCKKYEVNKLGNLVTDLKCILIVFRAFYTLKSVKLVLWKCEVPYYINSSSTPTSKWPLNFM